MPPVDMSASPALLAHSLRELEILVETARIGLALIRNGCIVRINARGADILGRPKTALCGMAVSSLFPDPDAYAALLASARQEAPTEGSTAECPIVRPDGGQPMIRLHVRWAGEAHRGETVTWSFEDMTERQTLEQELWVTKQAADTAGEAKNFFLANMSHELRTPLNGILGMAQLLLDGGEVQDEAREFLGIIRQSAGVLVRILGDLLDMSNVEAGRLRMEEREFDLRTECTPIFRNFIIQSHLHPFSFTYHIDPGIPSRLYGDPDRTKQILINLLDNAFKYTRQGQVTARIDLWRAEGTATAPPPGRVRLLVTIADTGIGIEPDRQKAVFEPFGIGEDYLTKKYSGAGLGLSIAKQLASMMGGDITLESEPGRGSTFLLTLEFGLSGSGQAEESASSPPPPRLEQPLRILLAEDEPVNRIFTARALQKCGHTVDTAVDGREALFMLGRAPYDLVLMDIQMPRLNGLDATRRIRSGQEPGIPPAIPVVALSAYAMESDQARGMEAGMDAYVTKPYDVADLLRTVRRVLSREDANRSQG